ncbi:MAG: flagellar hook assembly protein FlgD [Spirochaetota bacterium]
MDISQTLSMQEQSTVQSQVDAFNAALGNGRSASNSLGKDDFLSLLITQLKNQDPTSPMEDREFIAQMAQFSTLEQMTNMSNGFAQVTNLINSSQALGLIGKQVEVVQGSSAITGRVTEVSTGDYPQVRVDGTFYDLDAVERVME